MVKSRSHTARVLGVHFVLIGFLFFVVYPLLYVISVSFRSGQTLVDPENFLIPSNPTLEHWALAFEQNYTGMNPMRVDIEGVDKVNVETGIGTLTFNGDGNWTLVEGTKFNEADFPIKSYVGLAFLTRVGDRIPVEGANRRGIFNVTELVLDVEENRRKYGSSVAFIAPGETINGFIDVPNRPEAATRTTLQYGAAYVKQPQYKVLTWLWNTVKVATISAILILLFSTTGAYAFGRLGFKGRYQMLKALLIIQMFPNTLFLTALYLIFQKLGSFIGFMSLNTHSALIIGYMGGMALNIFMIKGYFDTIDPSMEESAAIDGATPWQTFYRILLPLSVPILAVVFILSFIGLVNEYPLASILIRDLDKMTLAVGATQYIQAQNQLWGDFAAAAVLAGIPITIVFLIAQRFLVGGLTAGGVKG